MERRDGSSLYRGRGSDLAHAYPGRANRGASCCSLVLGYRLERSGHTKLRTIESRQRGLAI